jgi:hypothetical protein
VGQKVEDSSTQIQVLNTMIYQLFMPRRASGLGPGA